MAAALSNMGIIYDLKKEDIKALELFERSLEMKKKHKKSNPKVDLGATFLNIGNIYLRKGNIKLALKYFNEAENDYNQVYGSISF